MGQLVFDERVSRQFERLYGTRDLVRRRALVRAALGARPGERILDVGCGPGFYVVELLEEVGPGGSVVGVDASPQMLALARARCAGHENVDLREGTATSLPVEDADVDAALCVQVLEYVADASAALAEMHRALRPGGRVLVWDIDWATVSWHSADPDRMRRVLHAWDGHLTHTSLPRTLPARLRSVGFEDVALEGHSFTTAELSPDTYGGALVPMLERFVTGRDGISAEEAKAWGDEQRELGGRGQFYFACVQVCVTATRPR